MTFPLYMPRTCLSMETPCTLACNANAHWDGNGLHIRLTKPRTLGCDTLHDRTPTRLLIGKANSQPSGKYFST